MNKTKIYGKLSPIQRLKRFLTRKYNTNDSFDYCISNEITTYN